MPDEETEGERADPGRSAVLEWKYRLRLNYGKEMLTECSEHYCVDTR